MSKKYAELVERFMLASRQPSRSGWSTRWLRDDINYELFIARHAPHYQRFTGRNAVEDYLAILRVGYQVLESGPIALIARGSEVVARGNDLARLKLSEEVVRVAWTQVFELEGDLIKRITVAIHRWTTIPINERVIVKSYLIGDDAPAASMTI